MQNSNLNLEPPAGLYQKVISRIRKEERILFIKQAIIFSAFSLVFLAGLFWALKIFFANLYASGFIHLSSLVFTDFSALAIYWQDLALAILQTLPVTDYILALVLLAFSIQSVRFAARNITSLKKYKYATN